MDNIIKAIQALDKKIEALKDYSFQLYIENMVMVGLLCKHIDIDGEELLKEGSELGDKLFNQFKDQEEIKNQINEIFKDKK